MAMLFISHDLPAVASLCDRVAILHDGEIVEDSTPEQIFRYPRHPYTQRLVSAIPAPFHAGGALSLLGLASQVGDSVAFR
jgi:ABC-type dipeptide/oligopeptide/nickel transport system ATPase component